jgi:hypothetical protein
MLSHVSRNGLESLGLIGCCLMAHGRLRLSMFPVIAFHETVQGITFFAMALGVPGTIVRLAASLDQASARADPTVPVSQGSGW